MVGVWSEVSAGAAAGLLLPRSASGGSPPEAVPAGRNRLVPHPV